MSIQAKNKPRLPRENADLITKTPGSHPIGTGVGAATAGVVGAAIGSVVPGVGTMIGGATGAVIGAVVGGLAGKEIAEVIDPTAESAYWRAEYRNRPYFVDDYSYEDDYEPAYMYGYMVRSDNREKTYEEMDEAALRNGWEKAKSKSKLKYEHAKQATKDAWHRFDSVKR